jgi:hypothetical protein
LETGLSNRREHLIDRDLSRIEDDNGFFGPEANLGAAHTS